MESLRKTGTALRARDYLRVSADRTGRLESPEEQHEVNRQHATQNGWTLGDPYAEDGAVSASRYSTKKRDAFGRLVADIASGQFAADVLILWESSRGSRKLTEWSGFIDACEKARIIIYVTTHGRAYDLANARDRRTLQEDGVDSEYESAKTSQRLRRTQAARAAAGREHGRVPYGYRRVYDPVTRELVRQEADLAEAPVVRELFARLRGGDSLRAITLDFAARGITTRGSAKWPPRPFTAENLRPLALNPAYIGKRVYRGADDERRRLGSLDGAVDATWPPLVDAETFHAVFEMLTGPGRRTSRPGRDKHKLSLIGRCGVCDGPLSVTYRRGPRQYTCRARSCIRVDAGELDRYARQILIGYLSRDDVIGKLRATPDDMPELSQVRADLAVARAELADWQARAGRREVSAGSFAAIEPGIVAGITALEQAERKLTTPPALAWLLAPGQDIAERLDTATIYAWREAARLLFTPAYLGWLKVGKSPVPGHTVPAWQRVTWDREQLTGKPQHAPARLT